MNLPPDQLTTHLSRSLGTLYTLHGDEPLLVIEAADAIRTAARNQGVSEREVLVTHQYFKWDEFGLATDNLSLFSVRKLIDLRIPNGKPGKQGSEALVRFAHEVSQREDGDITIITLPQLDWATRKSAWFAALSEAGAVIECNAPDLAHLPAWIAGRLAAQNQNASREALEFIALHVEGNLLAAHQEIQKLGLLYEQGTLTQEQIENAVLHVARYDTEKLRMALLEGNAARCALLLEGLKGEGAVPLLILWTMANEIRTLASLRSAIDNGQPLDAALRAERVFGPRQSLCRRAIQRLKSGTLRAALAHAGRIDRLIKGLQRGDVWDEFLLLALRIRAR